MSKDKQYVAPLGTSERVLASGRVIVPGERITLAEEDQKDEHNARLIEEGQLLEVQTKANPKKDGGE